MGLPDTVKIAKAYKKLAATTEYEDFEIELGMNEVAVILASQFNVHQATGNNAEVDAWIWQRTFPSEVPTDWSDADVPGWIEDSRVIDYFKWGRHYTIAGATYGFESNIANNYYKVYPYPQVCVRSPQLVTLCNNASALVKLSCMIWYLIEKVSDKELAKLMVKNHA